MTDYRDQFRACRSDGTTLPGNPETHQLLIPKRKPNGERVSQITSTPYVCGKFGGQCSSGNPKCREMRGAEPLGAPGAST